MKFQEVIKWRPFKQGCRSLLSIVGDNLQFYPIFNIGGMNFDHNFFRVSKLSEDQKKVFDKNGTLFFPEFRWRPKKKKVFTKTGALFSPNSRTDLRSDAHQSQSIGVGCRCRPRRVARNSQGGLLWGSGGKAPAAGSWGFGGKAPSRRRHWGLRPQRSKILHFFAKII